jgi:hypothetical protein
MLIPSIAATIRAFVGSLANRLGDAIFRRDELQRCDRREIESIARELNVSPTELGDLVSMPSDSIVSLSKRLSHAGLSETSLATSHPEVLRDLQRVCSQCPSKARCARDLGRERRATPSKYCPNEQTLQALAREAASAGC